jgi:hypothetical protein
MDEYKDTLLDSKTVDAATKSVASLSKGRHAIRNLVLNALSCGRKFTLTDISEQVNGKNEKRVTYQGIRKAVLALAKEGVLQKEMDKYFIDPDWAGRMRKNLEDIETSAKSSGFMPLESMPRGWKQSIEFDAPPARAYYFMLEQSAKAWFLTPEKERYLFCLHAHTLTTTLLELEQFEILKLMSKNGRHLVFTAGNTKLDRCLAEIFEKIEAKVHFDPLAPSVAVKTIVGEYIVKVIPPRKFQQELDRIYKKFKGFDQRTQEELRKLYFESGYIVTDISF